MTTIEVIDTADLSGFREDLIESLTVSAGPVQVVSPERAERIVTNLEQVVRQNANAGARKIVIPALVASTSLAILAIVIAVR